MTYSYLNYSIHLLQFISKFFNYLIKIIHYIMCASSVITFNAIIYSITEFFLWGGLGTLF